MSPIQSFLIITPRRVRITPNGKSQLDILAEGPITIREIKITTAPVSEDISKKVIPVRLDIMCKCKHQLIKNEDEMLYFQPWFPMKFIHV
jgi:hypothetical protein